MKTETNGRRDFLKTLVKAGLAGAATMALATQAQAEEAATRKPAKRSYKRKQ